MKRTILVVLLCCTAVAVSIGTRSVLTWRTGGRTAPGRAESDSQAREAISADRPSAPPVTDPDDDRFPERAALLVALRDLQPTMSDDEYDRKADIALKAYIAWDMKAFHDDNLFKQSNLIGSVKSEDNRAEKFGRTLDILKESRLDPEYVAKCIRIMCGTFKIHPDKFD
jgi:hypothetical protein